MGARGDRRLTRRQADVLGALLEGLSDKEIACRLGVSVSCAKFHVQSLYRKYRVHDRRGLAGKFGRFEVEVRWVPAARPAFAAQAADASRMFRDRVRIED